MIHKYVIIYLETSRIYTNHVYRSGVPNQLGIESAKLDEVYLYIYIPAF
jgi:hypothetical protein